MNKRQRNKRDKKHRLAMKAIGVKYDVFFNALIKKQIATTVVVGRNE